MTPTVSFLSAAGVRPDVASIYAPHLATACAKFGITEREQVAGLVAEGLHETGMLKRFTENMNYSAERLMVVWPSRFPTHAIADRYANNEQALANFVYGGRMGNGAPETNEGYLYRGSGFLQITGHDNFASATRDLKIDFLKQPDLARTVPEHQILIGAWFWYTRGLNTLIKTGGIDACSKKINPGQGKDELERRHSLYARCFALTTD